jgi:hypothetical protein
MDNDTSWNEKLRDLIIKRIPNQLKYIKIIDDIDDDPLTEDSDYIHIERTLNISNLPNFPLDDIFRGGVLLGGILNTISDSFAITTLDHDISIINVNPNMKLDASYVIDGHIDILEQISNYNIYDAPEMHILCSPISLDNIINLNSSYIDKSKEYQFNDSTSIQKDNIKYNINIGHEIPFNDYNTIYYINDYLLHIGEVSFKNNTLSLEYECLVDALILKY